MYIREAEKSQERDPRSKLANRLFKLWSRVADLIQVVGVIEIRTIRPVMALKTMVLADFQ